MVNDLGADWAGNLSGAETDPVVAALEERGGVAVGVNGDVVSQAAKIVAAAIEAIGRSTWSFITLVLAGISTR